MIVLPWMMSKEGCHFTKFIALKNYFLASQSSCDKKWYNQNHLKSNMTHGAMKAAE